MTLIHVQAEFCQNIFIRKTQIIITMGGIILLGLILSDLHSIIIQDSSILIMAIITTLLW